MSIDISREIEVRLTDEARRRGISVESLLERLMSEDVAPITCGGSTTEVPILRLGAMSALHRRDLYNDVD